MQVVGRVGVREERVRDDEVAAVGDDAAEALAVVDVLVQVLERRVDALGVVVECLAQL
jgi:hypothetical protein